MHACHTLHVHVYLCSLLKEGKECMCIHVCLLCIRCGNRLGHRMVKDLRSCTCTCIHTVTFLGLHAQYYMYMCIINGAYMYMKIAKCPISRPVSPITPVWITPSLIPRLSSMSACNYCEWSSKVMACMHAHGGRTGNKASSQHLTHHTVHM